MSSLYELQQALQNHLRDAESPILSHLKPPYRGAIDERLAVYTNGYRCRLIDALQREYSVLLAYLGNSEFTRFADDFIDTYPSQYYSINDFARQFPEFLAKVLKPTQGYWIELAELSRALNQSVEAKDEPILEQTALQTIPPESWPLVCFRLQASVQILNFKWNTFELWKTWVQEKKLFEPFLQSVHCIVWRKELQSYAHCLTSVEWMLLSGLQNRLCFEQLCEAIYQEGGVDETEAAMQVAQCLTRWLSSHLFSEVYIP
jgi:hypothetical protein